MDVSIIPGARIFTKNKTDLCILPFSLCTGGIHVVTIAFKTFNFIEVVVPEVHYIELSETLLNRLDY